MRTERSPNRGSKPLEVKVAQARNLVWELRQGLRRRFERFTRKQMGDAGEMLVAAELTLHGIPAFLVPSQWRAYDVVGQCPERGLQRISVKTRNFTSSNFVSYGDEDEFDWLAIVVLPATTRYRRRTFIVPRDVANTRSYESPDWDGRGFHVYKLVRWPNFSSDSRLHLDCGLADYEDNFCLSGTTRLEPRAYSRWAPSHC
jgi:hypothetical protein